MDFLLLVALDIITQPEMLISMQQDCGTNSENIRQKIVIIVIYCMFAKN